MFQVILEKTIRIPRSLSVRAASVLKGFLNKNPADRLGCHRESAFMDIVSHPFFKNMDWELVSPSRAMTFKFCLCVLVLMFVMMILGAEFVIQVIR